MEFSSAKEDIHLNPDSIEIHLSESNRYTQKLGTRQLFRATACNSLQIFLL